MRFVALQCICIFDVDDGDGDDDGDVGGKGGKKEKKKWSCPISGVCPYPCPFSSSRLTRSPSEL